MDDLYKALGDISSIRRQVAESTQFRGYGPATLAATGGIALLAAWTQSMWLPEPGSHVRSYLILWISTAAVSCGLTGWQMWARTRRIHSGMSNEMLRMAVEQFLPALGAGALLTWALAHFAAAEVWMLPGLWQVISGLGIFSSCRFLPRAMNAAGAWYVLTGLLCITLGNGGAMAPWTMGLGYGGGQMLMAAILWGTTERTDES